MRLASVLQASDYLASHTSVTNYTAVDPLLGTLEDLRMLGTQLHQRDMYLLMDLPLAHATGKVQLSSFYFSFSLYELCFTLCHCLCKMSNFHFAFSLGSLVICFWHHR